MSLLQLEKVSVHFGGVKAVNEVTFTVNQGDVFSIIGPNGAGKTTVFNLISRIYNLHTGVMRFDGYDFSKLATHKVAKLGIARTFQNTELFEHETLLKNLLIGRHTHRKTHLLAEFCFLPSVHKQELAFRRVAEKVIDLLDLQSYRHQVIGNLPYGVRKMVEIGRALCMEPKLLLLDEPSSGLNPEETEDLGFWIEDVNEELGVTVMMVEHDMSLVSRVSNKVLALCDGEVIAQGSPDDIRNNAQVSAAYLGEEHFAEAQ